MGQPRALQCSRCGTAYDPGHLRNLCDCGGPLLVQYDLPQLRTDWHQASIAAGPSSMWRYHPVLPCNPDAAVSLGEGWTPLKRLERLGPRLGLDELWIKDEGQNPTDSFKARGLSCAVSMARALGAERLAIPTAGNAGSALAAYASAAGLQSFIFMPADAPQANFIECKAYGAQVTLVDGLISDCGRMVAEGKQAAGWFEVSTLKEPYRIEGKKTMGYEVAEQFGWRLPDAILYPCGGGVGLIGMWKAFWELEQLGWIDGTRPKMIAVQAAGCQPIVEAWRYGANDSTYYKDAHTVASGLRVPKPLGDALVLAAIRESGGVAVAAGDEAMLDAGLQLASEEGIFPAPEGGACMAALPGLLASGVIRPQDRVVVFNTGSGLKYLEAYATRFSRHGAADSDKLGGLILPR